LPISKKLSFLAPPSSVVHQQLTNFNTTFSQASKNLNSALLGFVLWAIKLGKNSETALHHFCPKIFKVHAEGVPLDP